MLSVGLSTHTRITSRLPSSPRLNLLCTVGHSSSHGPVDFVIRKWVAVNNDEYEWHRTLIVSYFLCNHSSRRKEAALWSPEKRRFTRRSEYKTQRWPMRWYKLSLISNRRSSESASSVAIGNHIETDRWAQFRMRPDFTNTRQRTVPPPRVCVWDQELPRRSRAHLTAT